MAAVCRRRCTSGSSSPSSPHAAAWGTGLGLNIVYNLVTRKLQGRLEFHSEEGAGVHFLLWLPRRLESAEPA